MTNIHYRTLNLMIRYLQTKPLFIEYVQHKVSSPVSKEQFDPKAVIIRVRPYTQPKSKETYAVSVFDLTLVNRVADANLMEDVDPDLIEVVPCVCKHRSGVTYYASRQKLILLEESNFAFNLQVALDAKDYHKAYYMLSTADKYDFESEYELETQAGTFGLSVLHCLVLCGIKALFEAALRQADDYCVLADIYDVSADDYRYSTILHLIAKYGHIELLLSLITIRPDLMPVLANCLCFSHDGSHPSSNSTEPLVPLQVALMNGHYELASLLFKYTKSKHMSTVLIDAVRAQNVRLVELLLGAKPRTEAENMIVINLCGSLITIKSHDNYTALHIAARTGNSRIFELVYGAAVTTGLLLDRSNKNRLTFFTCLVQKRDAKTIAWLMQRDDFDPRLLTMTNCFNERPLHWASMFGFLEICTLLYGTYVKEGLVLERDTFGNTALTFAIRGKHTGIVDFLTNPQLSNGLIDMDDGKGYTSLSLAIEYGNIDICSILYERMSIAQINNQANKHGYTVLHRAALLGTTAHIDIILRDTVKSQRLLYVRDAEGKTALQLAQARSPEMYEHLLKAYQRFEQ